jgi:plastocyanin
LHAAREPFARAIKLAMGGRVTVVTLFAFGALAAPAQADVAVTVANDAFSPSTVEVFEGEVVNWNFAHRNHTVTSEAQNEQQGSFDSDPNNTFQAPASGTFSKEFIFVGEYKYFCKVHSFMTGRVVVRDRVNNSTPPPVDSVAPKFGTTRVSVRKRRVTFRLNEPASVTGRLRGRMRRNLTLDGKAGRNKLKLPKRMRPGRYRLTLRATDESGNESRAVTRRFRVPKKS